MTHYVAFTDAAGGSGHDAFTLAIAHGDQGKAILDCVRARKPPFSPDGVCADYATVLQSYGLTTVTGDQYADAWVRERFALHGIAYRVSGPTKSELFVALVPLLNAGRVELLDLPELRAQFQALERRVSAGGREQIVHLVGAHDDLANAVAGALVLAAGGGEPGWIAFIRAEAARANAAAPRADRENYRAFVGRMRETPPPEPEPMASPTPEAAPARSPAGLTMQQRNATVLPTECPACHSHLVRPGPSPGQWACRACGGHGGSR
jgi:hypothetical protein